MRLVDLVRDETGAEYAEIMLLRHSNDSIGKLLACGGSIEEYAAMQPTGTKWDFRAKGKPPIHVVAVIVESRVFGVYRVAGVEAEGTTYSLVSEAHRRFDIERGKPDRPARRFALKRVSCDSDSWTVSGWEGKEINPVLRSNKKDGLFWKIEVLLPNRPPINIEDRELTDVQIAAALKEGRLRLGMVPTSSVEALARHRRGCDVLRKLTLENYDGCCAICDIQDLRLLRVSHIVGWAEREDTRGNLNNVICLCSFHDVLFEHGYWSLDDRFGVISRSDIKSDLIRRLLSVECRFRRPIAHSPATEFVRHHRQKHGLSLKQLVVR